MEPEPATDQEEKSPGISSDPERVRLPGLTDQPMRDRQRQRPTSSSSAAGRVLVISQPEDQSGRNARGNTA